MRLSLCTVLNIIHIHLATYRFNLLQLNQCCALSRSVSSVCFMMSWSLLANNRIYNDKDCSYYELLLRANVPSSLIKWQRILATEVFKALQGISPSYIQDLFMEEDVHYTLRASKIVIQPKCQSTTHGLNSLTYQGAKPWNSLLEHIKGAETVGQFQSYINTHLL